MNIGEKFSEVKYSELSTKTAIPIRKEPIVVFDDAGNPIGEIKGDGVTALKDLPIRSTSTIKINSQTASYTLVLSDAGKLITINVSTANTLTVPANASVAFPVGTQIVISQTGAGQTTVTPATGVVINSADGATKTRVQFSSATLIKTGADAWSLMGDIAV